MIEGILRIPFEDGGIAWDPSLVFPGLAPGRAARQQGPPRAAGRRSSPATGPRSPRDRRWRAARPSAARRSTSPARSAKPEGAEAEAAAEEGFPPGTPVGVSGLEQAFNARLAGKPGGELLAVAESGGQPRVLGSAEPSNGEAVKTTIDPDLQLAAVSALAGRSGGVAVLDARTGDVRALAGPAFSGPQPPGSTFKIVTTTAALQNGVVSLDDEFQVVDGANVGGRFIYNAHGEYCGGNFRESFAHSCNSVFAPLGVEVGDESLVATAERFGFNSEPTLYDAEGTAAIDPPESTIPRDPGDRRRPRGQRDRPGPGAGDPAADGDRSPDGRQRRRQAADPLVVKPELGPTRSRCG